MHQGRAAENIISRSLRPPGSVVPMNYHFTTSKAHICSTAARWKNSSSTKGWRSPASIRSRATWTSPSWRRSPGPGADNIAFVRIETGTNLIGGQPLSLENLRQVRKVCDRHGIMLVFDASLLADNLYFIKTREEACKGMSVREITREIADLADIIYFSARKLGCARGGGICTKNHDLFMKMRELVTLYEGFLTYGGMSVREIEAITVGLEETMDEDMICQGPQFIKFMVDELNRKACR